MFAKALFLLDIYKVQNSRYLLSMVYRHKQLPLAGICLLFAFTGRNICPYNGGLPIAAKLHYNQWLSPKFKHFQGRHLHILTERRYSGPYSHSSDKDACRCPAIEIILVKLDQIRFGSV